MDLAIKTNVRAIMGKLGSSQRPRAPKSFENGQAEGSFQSERDPRRHRVASSADCCCRRAGRNHHWTLSERAQNEQERLVRPLWFQGKTGGGGDCTRR